MSHVQPARSGVNRMRFLAKTAGAATFGLILIGTVVGWSAASALPNQTAAMQSPLGATSRGYEIAYFDGSLGSGFEADKTTSAQAIGDRYDIHVELLCNSTYSGKTIYVTLEYDDGSGFQTYTTWPVPLDMTGCGYPTPEGTADFVAFIDGMGANSVFRLEVSDPDLGLFDFLGFNFHSYVEWVS